MLLGLQIGFFSIATFLVGWVQAGLVFALQPAQTGAASAVAEATGASGGGGGLSSGMLNIPIMIAMFAAFYFLLIRPQTKQRKEHEELLKSLRKGNIVRTQSGIRGEIVDISETEATLLIADKTKINILTSFIAGRVDTSEGKG